MGREARRERRRGRRGATAAAWERGLQNPVVPRDGCCEWIVPVGFEGRRRLLAVLDLLGRRGRRGIISHGRELRRLLLLLLLGWLLLRLLLR